MVDRVTERTDGVTAERVTEHGGGTTIVERRGGGGGILIGIAVLILAVIAGIYFINQNNNEAIKTDAVTEAARSVERGADKVGDAAAKAGDAVVDETTEK